MRRFLSALAILSCATAAQAQHAHAPHEHGVAELQVVVEGELLQIEFASPLDNLVGFEHAPRTARQRKALDEAERGLRAFERLFVLPAAAGCTLTGTELEHPFGADDGHEHGAHDHGNAGGHAELGVRYTLRCAAPAALDTVQVELFDAFPQTRQIRAQWVSPRGQGSAVLTAKRRALPL